MFKFFRKKSEEVLKDNEEKWNSDNVKVYYEGEVLSPDYARYTLLYPNDGSEIRKEFNDQPKDSYHMIYPDGWGKIKYIDEQAVSEGFEGILEIYEGEFYAGQYQGKGKLIDRHGEILEGEFKANKFIGKSND